jgi:integrase
MGLYMRKDSPFYWMCFTVNNKSYQRSTGTDNKKVAKDIYSKVKTLIVEGKWFEFDEARQHTFEEMMIKFMAEHAPKVEPSTKRRYESALGHLKPFFGGLLLSEITPPTISEYIAKRREAQAAASTINKEYCMLSKAFSLAWGQWEWCNENPCRKVPREKEDNQIIRWLSDEEEDSLMAGAKGYLNGQLVEMITIALHTGLRQGELVNLKWKDVDLFRKTIIIPKPKNKEPKTLPVNDTVFDLLLAKSKVINMTGYVFTTASGLRINARNLQREFCNARTKAAEKTPEISNFRWHDMRHTFATRLIQAGVDIGRVAELLGHKDLKMTRRYAHHNPESLRNSVKILDNLQSKKVAKKKEISG